ncbi:MAG: L,D-transpeptidase [Tenuifilaceae bacterium]
MLNEEINSQEIVREGNVEEEPVSKKQSSRKGLKTLLKTAIISLLSILLILFLIVYIVYIVPSIQETGKGKYNTLSNNIELKEDNNYKKQIKLIEKEVQQLSKKISGLTPWQPYLIISTTNNRFSLYQNRKLIREGFCSSGSYTLLLTEGSQKWTFKTPKGKFWIQTKMIDPIWKKPDWAFVEEGLPVPSANHDSRFEYGVLGDYALSIGDGYLIHGTIYKRFLGMPVTHGCIRLNDDDLESIYKTLDFGSKVFIY